MGFVFVLFSDVKFRSGMVFRKAACRDLCEEESKKLFNELRSKQEKQIAMIEDRKSRGKRHEKLKKDQYALVDLEELCSGIAIPQDFQMKNADENKIEYPSLLQNDGKTIMKSTDEDKTGNPSQVPNDVLKIDDGLGMKRKAEEDAKHFCKINKNI